MKKKVAFVSFTLLIVFSPSTAVARTSATLRRTSLLAPAGALAAPPQAAEEKKPQWKSTEEYNAFTAMANEKDPNKKVSLARAFLEKYSNSDFKDLASVQMMTGYQQAGDAANAIAAGEKALEYNPDNLDALRFISFAFPFVYKPNDSDATAKLSRAGSDAKHGLELLAKLQKPANVTDEQFTQAIKQIRAVFNSAIGFVDLQQKDYPAAATSLKAATEDDPSNNLTFSLLGQAYLSSTPPDYDNAIWNLARSVALAKAAKSPNADALQKYLDQVYVNRHGSDQGENDVLTQAATSVNAPEGFKVAPAERHKPTGNAAIDAFYSMEDSLKLGTEQEKQSAWAQIKGQPFGYGGKVDSIEHGSDADATSVHIAITDESKAKEGSYDIVLRDKQPDAKFLSKGDLVHFAGTIADKTETPSFSLTLDGTIPDDDLAAAKEKAKTKTKPRTAPRRRTTRRG